MQRRKWEKTWREKLNALSCQSSFLKTQGPRNRKTLTCSVWSTFFQVMLYCEPICHQNVFKTMILYLGFFFSYYKTIHSRRRSFRNWSNSKEKMRSTVNPVIQNCYSQHLGRTHSSFYAFITFLSELHRIYCLVTVFHLMYLKHLCIFSHLSVAV